jgi:hypothetical protein
MLSTDVAWPGDLAADVLAPSVLMGRVLDAAADEHAAELNFKYRRDALVVPQSADEKHLRFESPDIVGIGPRT